MPSLTGPKPRGTDLGASPIAPQLGIQLTQKPEADSWQGLRWCGCWHLGQVTEVQLRETLLGGNVRRKNFNEAMTSSTSGCRIRKGVAADSFLLRVKVLMTVRSKVTTAVDCYASSQSPKAGGGDTARTQRSPLTKLHCAVAPEMQRQIHTRRVHPVVLVASPLPQLTGISQQRHSSYGFTSAMGAIVPPLLARGYARPAIYLVGAFLLLIFIINTRHLHSARIVPEPKNISLRHSGYGASIAKISTVSAAMANNSVYQGTMALHDRHNAKFGYPMFTLNEEILPPPWNKPLWILSVLAQELAKAPEQRLKWLVWMDSDVTLMNPNVPLELFLPPQKTWPNINMVVTNDHNGLNNGVFYLRVHPWSVDLMTTVLSIKKYEPGVDLEFEEQTAMELWILSDAYRENVMHVPQQWFNAEPGGWTSALLAKDKSSKSKNTRIRTTKGKTIRQGDLLVHHTMRNEKKKMEHMAAWLDLADSQDPAWEKDPKEIKLADQVKEFWETDAKKESASVDTMIQEADARRDRRSKDG